MSGIFLLDWAFSYFHQTQQTAAETDSSEVWTSPHKEP